MKRILVYRFSALGDVAMMVPVLKEFLEQNPTTEVVFLSRNNFSGLFQNIPRLDFKGINLKEYSGFWGLQRLSKEIISTYKPDLCADLHDVLRSRLLNLFFSIHGKKVFRLEKGRRDKKELTNVHHIHKHPLKTTPERYADVFRAMGFSLELSHKYSPKSTNKNGIGFAPFAQHKGKMLPLETSLVLVKEVSKYAPVFLFGGGEREKEILDSWAKETSNVFSLVGKLSLKEELEKISQLRVMISMDSANMHLASLVGTRCISIWGATHSFAGFLGYGQHHEDVVEVTDLTCRPCSVFGNKECFRGDWACLNEINPQKIIEKIKPLVK